jgi:hypothetical protein
VEDRVLEIVGLDSESGLITGDFAIPEGFALTPTHATRGLVAKTPLFSRNHLLSGTHYARDRRFRAQSGLG